MSCGMYVGGVRLPAYSRSFCCISSLRLNNRRSPFWICSLIFVILLMCWLFGPTRLSPSKEKEKAPVAVSVHNHLAVLTHFVVAHACHLRNSFLYVSLIFCWRALLHHSHFLEGVYECRVGPVPIPYSVAHIIAHIFDALIGFSRTL